ncbi:hypothetical protein ACWGE0_43755 [Lentzea sp. NPDC054927]
MSRRGTRRPHWSDAGILGAAGWLFAELALLLAIVALGSGTAADNSPATITPPSSATPSTTPGKSHSEGLSLTSVKFTMGVSADDAAVVSTFTTNLTNVVGPQAKVGLIMLFGTSANPTSPVAGTLISERVKRLIAPAGLPQLASKVDIRTYFGGDGVPGDVTVELFVLTGSS